MADTRIKRIHPDKLFDKRITDRNIRVGLITPDLLDKELARLPDVADKGELVTVAPPRER